MIWDISKRLIYTPRNVDPKKIPNIINFVESFKNEITCKEVKEGKHPFYSLHRARKPEIFEKDSKILGVITSDQIIVAFDYQQSFPTDGIFLFSTGSKFKDKVVTGLLNSKLTTYFYRLISLEVNRTLAQIKPKILKEIPFKLPSSQKQKEIANKVEEIIKEKNEAKSTDNLSKK